MTNTDKTVEEIYHEHIRTMSSREKQLKAAKMYLNMKAMVERQILKDSPGLSGMALKRAVAKRFYMHDPIALQLIEMGESHD